MKINHENEELRWDKSKWRKWRAYLLSWIHRKFSAAFAKCVCVCVLARAGEIQRLMVLGDSWLLTVAACFFSFSKQNSGSVALIAGVCNACVQRYKAFCVLNVHIPFRLIILYRMTTTTTTTINLGTTIFQCTHHLAISLIAYMLCVWCVQLLPDEFMAI